MQAAQAQAPATPVGTPGLAVDYYRGYFYGDQLFFSATAPAVRARPVEQLNFGEAETDNFSIGPVATYYSPGKPDEFSGRFQGQLYVTTAGDYTFYLGSDDAAYLWLDNGTQPVASNQGDTFPYRETSGTRTLTLGLHTIRVDYGEHGGSQGLVLEYSGPNMPRQLVPNGVLYSQPTAAIRPTLTQFEAVADNQQVNLSWKTGAEENSTAFVVEKSTDGQRFSELLRRPGAATTMAPQAYTAIDQQPIMGTNYYRLQQLRSDRPAVFSPIKSVEIKPIPFEVSVYPVPNNGTFYLKIQPTNIGVAALELLDVNGRRVFRQQIQLTNGATQLIKPELAIGLYFLRLSTEIGKFNQKISLGN